MLLVDCAKLAQVGSNGSDKHWWNGYTKSRKVSQKSNDPALYSQVYVMEAIFFPFWKDGG